MAYSLHPATVQDAPAIAEIFQEAFKDNPIMGYFYKDTPKDLALVMDIKYFPETLRNGTLHGRRYTKMVEDSTGKAVAFVSNQYPHRLTPEQTTIKDRKTEEALKEPQPSGAQAELIGEWDKYISAGREKWIDPENTYFVHLLAVRPDHQGKGLGGRLLTPGLEEADKAGALTYIEASPAGLPVYLNYEWKIVDGFEIDMRPYGGHGIEHLTLLLREPGATRQIN